MVSVSSEILDSNQLLLIPLVMEAVEHDPGILCTHRLDVHNSLTALPIYSNMKNTGSAAFGDDIVVERHDPVMLEVERIEHVSDLEAGGGRISGYGDITVQVEGGSLPFWGPRRGG